MNRLYKPTPDGYCGDEDNGQTSAWYVFSAMGFYPVCPATDQYVLGAPLFKKITIAQENGKQLIISAPANSDKNIYIQDIQLNEKRIGQNWLNHFDLQKGGTVKFMMGPLPNKQRGTKEEDAPFSMSNGK